MNGDRGAHSLADRILESPITWLITAINLGVFLIAYLHDGRSKEGLSVETLHAYGGAWRYSVQGGEYWRLLTAIFLHGGWIHLIVNTVFLFGWCADLERTVGSIWFSVAYFTTGIAASAVSVIAHPVLSVGASGAGFGIVAATLSVLYRRAGSWEDFIASPGVRRILGFTVIFLVVGFTMMRHVVDNYAHLGGFALGVPCGLILESRRGRSRPLWIAGVVAYMVAVTGLVVVACIPGLGFGRPGE
jgi:rhomboid protease GluP